VAFEGRISQRSVQSELSKGNKASGDLIPWTVSQQFNDTQFASLSGARIVRIATHPDVQKMGYGSRAVDLLLAYFQGEMTLDALHPSSGVFGGEGEEGVARKSGAKKAAEGGADLTSEVVAPEAELPPLLAPIAARPAELLHWVGASFGLTSELMNFWSRKGFKVCYLRQTRNELTGEHSAIALRELAPIGDRGGGGREGRGGGATVTDAGPPEGWLAAFVRDYRRRLIALMAFNFKTMEIPLSVMLLDPDRRLTSTTTTTPTATSGPATPASTSLDFQAPISALELLSVHLSHHDMQRLELYARNMVDHHMVLDTVPALTALLFQVRMTIFTPHIYTLTPLFTPVHPY
jgi:N-acetyltransferase 10